MESKEEIQSKIAELDKKIEEKQYKGGMSKKMKIVIAIIVLAIAFLGTIIATTYLGGDNESVENGLVTASGNTTEEQNDGGQLEIPKEEPKPTPTNNETEELNETNATGSNGNDGGGGNGNGGHEPPPEKIYLPKCDSYIEYNNNSMYWNCYVLFTLLEDSFNTNNTITTVDFNDDNEVGLADLVIFGQQMNKTNYEEWCDNQLM
jgi:hypothetical protein